MSSLFFPRLNTVLTVGAAAAAAAAAHLTFWLDDLSVGRARMPTDAKNETWN